MAPPPPPTAIHKRRFVGRPLLNQGRTDQPKGRIFLLDRTLPWSCYRRRCRAFIALLIASPLDACCFLNTCWSSRWWRPCQWHQGSPRWVRPTPRGRCWRQLRLRRSAPSSRTCQYPQPVSPERGIGSNLKASTKEMRHKWRKDYSAYNDSVYCVRCLLKPG